MKHPVRIRKRLSVLLQFIIVISAVIGTFLYPNYVYSQSINDFGQEWAEPLNLSQSSGTSRPGMVMDSSGVLHVFWEDFYRGFIYRKLTDEGWRDPATTNFPFKLSRVVTLSGYEDIPLVPKFIPDKNGRVHALWIDSRNVLLHSIVPEKYFGNYDAWLTPQIIADAVLDMDIAIDASGNIHLAYVKSSPSVFNKSGIYYRKLVNGLYWEDSFVLYESPYFRSINENSANVDVSTAEGEDGDTVYVAWDNRPLNRIYSVISKDSGVNWGEIFEVDGPSQSTTGANPKSVQVMAKNQQVLYIWQIDHPGEGCIQFYKNSSDGGETWNERRTMLNDFEGCPESNELLGGISNNPITLLSTLENQVYLSLWNGEKWSRPQLQPILSEYVDPETLNVMTLEEKSYLLSSKNRLFAVGSATIPGEEQGDIWITDRSLGPLDDWFASENEWSNYESIASSNSPILSSAIVADEDGWAHVFWSIDEESEDLSQKQIFYTRWNGNSWSSPVDILISSFGSLSPLVATINGNGKLYLVWADNQSGDVYFSSANKNTALSSTEWSDPVQLPSPWPLTTQPDIDVDEDGRISIVYSIPVNEFRGVYFIQSDDEGKTWTAPSIVLDGVSEGWVQVGEPRIKVLDSDHIYLLFYKYLLPIEQGKKILYYSMSDDGGMSWEDPQEVSENLAVWGGIMGNEDQLLHRFWQEDTGSKNTFIHEYSLDQGKTWQKSSPIQNFDVINEPASIALDRSGILHLIQVKQIGSKNRALQHWIFEDESWFISEITNVTLSPEQEITDLMVTTDGYNGLSAILAARKFEEEGNQYYGGLYFANYSMGKPQAQPTPLPTLAPSAEEEAVGVENVASEPSQPEVVDFSDDGQDGPAVTGRLTNIVIGAGIGVIAAIGIVIAVLMISRRNE